MALIQDIIAKHISDKKGSHVFVSRLAIAAIAREYHKAREPEHTPIASKSEIEKAYSEGYKMGYMHRSDWEYDRLMFSEWKKHVAGTTEQNAQFNAHARENEEVTDVDEAFKLFKPK